MDFRPQFFGGCSPLIVRLYGLEAFIELKLRRIEHPKDESVGQVRQFGKFSEFHDLFDLIIGKDHLSFKYLAYLSDNNLILLIDYLRYL